MVWSACRALVDFEATDPRAARSRVPGQPSFPAFGHKNHVSIDRGFSLMRNSTTHDAAHDWERLRGTRSRRHAEGCPNFPVITAGGGVDKIFRVDFH
jgi:hypothetical protein